MKGKDIFLLVLFFLAVAMLITAILPCPVEKAWNLMGTPDYDLELAFRAAL